MFMASVEDGVEGALQERSGQAMMSDQIRLRLMALNDM